MTETVWIVMGYPDTFPTYAEAEKFAYLVGGSVYPFPYIIEKRI